MKYIENLFEAAIIGIGAALLGALLVLFSPFVALFCIIDSRGE